MTLNQLGTATQIATDAERERVERIIYKAARSLYRYHQEIADELKMLDSLDAESAAVREQWLDKTRRALLP